MRRHLERTSSIPTLSVEEAAIAADETNQQMMELDATVQETERMGDIIVTMNDVQTVVSNTPEISTPEQSLISAAADMAVAGTDADPEMVAQDMLPPAEGVSAEGIVSNVKNAALALWEQVRLLIKKAWAHFKKFLADMGSFLSGNKRRAAKLEEARKAEEDLKRARDAEAFREAHNRWQAQHHEAMRQKLHDQLNKVVLSSKDSIVLTVGYHGRVNPASLAKQLEDTYKTHLIQYDAVRSGLTDLAEIMAQGIEQIVSKPLEIEKLIGEMAAKYNPRFDTLRDIIVKQTHNGEQCLFASGISYNEVVNPPEVMHGIHRASFNASTNGDILMGGRDQTVEPLSEQSVDAIQELVVEQTKQMEKLNGDANFKRYEKAVERLDKAIDRLVKTVMWEKVESDMRMRGHGDHLDEILKRSQNLDQFKIHLVQTAKTISSAGPISILMVAKASAKIGASALDYAYASTNLRASKIVENGLAKFDIENKPITI